MSGMSGRMLYGRAAELAAVAALIEVARDGDGGCLVVEGPRGSGRTALLDALRCSPPADSIILRAAGSADEQVLAYGVLSDLCTPLRAHLDELPDIQQRALRGAIALGPPAGDRLAVAAGFLSLLRTAAEAEPLVVVVVDDAHQLDDGSATAISYAARRLDGCPIAMLLSQDADAGTRLKLADVPRVRLGPIGFEDAIDLVRDLAPDTTPAVAEALIATSDALPGRLARSVQAATPGRRASRPPDLDEAGQRAVARRSPADEAAVHERTANELDGPERTAALIRAGDAWLAAGRPDRARARGDEALDGADGSDQIRARLLLARATLATGSGREARRALGEVADLAEGMGEDHLAARALLISLPLHLHLGRMSDARAALARARQLLEPMPERPEEIHLLLRAAEVGVALATAEPVDPVELVRLLDAGLQAPSRSEVPVLVTTVVMPLVWADRLSAARHVLESIISHTRERGALGMLALPLAALATVERRAGRSPRALAAAAEAEQLAEETGDRVALLFARAELANVLAQRGDGTRARTVARSLLEGDRPVQGSLEASARSALATVDLIEGHWQGVVDVLEPLASSDAGGLSPLVTLYQQNLAVAYARLGRRSDAEAIVGTLERAASLGAGLRLPAVIERCRGMLAPRGEYDAHFDRAISLAGGNDLGVAITHLMRALRLVDDGRTTEAIDLLSTLATSTDDNTFGVARTARRTLAELGIALAGRSEDQMERLSDEELRVVLASADGRSIDDIADELRTTPGEVTRLRASAYRTLGVHTTTDLHEALAHDLASAGGAGRAGGDGTGTRVRLLDGLVVERDGQRLSIPVGAAATTVAVVALARTIHVEKLIEILWPSVPADVGRRRVRNVLARVRTAVGPVVHRHGEQLVLDDAVVVDVHEIDAALAVATDRRRPDHEREEARARALRLCTGVLLPEHPFADWTSADRARLSMARNDLLRELVERTAASGAPDEALAIAEQALAIAELALDSGRPSRALGLVRRARAPRAARCPGDRSPR